MRLVEPEAAAIRKAAADVIEGTTVRAIAQRWNDEHIATPGGKTWKPVVVKRLLGSPRIAGLRTVGDGTEPAGWAAIITPDQHDKLRTLLSSPERATQIAPPSSRSYLLTGGIARCALCGTGLSARPDGQGRRGYVCSSGAPAYGCGRIRIAGRHLDDEVATQVLARIMRPKARRMIADMSARLAEEAGRASEQIEEARKRHADLGESYIRGSVSGVTVEAATTELNRQVAEARRVKKLAKEMDSIAVVESRDLVEWWEGASLEQQRTLVSLLIESVEVSPVKVRGSKIFDPSRVKINWRK